MMKNLTLNLGLRYETYTPWVEVKDRRLTSRRSAAKSSSQAKATIYSDNAARLYNSYNWALDFQPRFGFAWTPGCSHADVRDPGSLHDLFQLS